MELHIFAKLDSDVVHFIEILWVFILDKLMAFIIPDDYFVLKLQEGQTTMEAPLIRPDAKLENQIPVARSK